MKNIILFLSALCTFFVFAYSDSNNPDSDHITLKHQSDAWGNFSALMSNASSIERGNAETPESFNNNKESVWETWKQHYEIYLDSGEQPSLWNNPQIMPTACNIANNAEYPFRGRKVLDSIYQAVKSDATLDSSLTDQNGNLVRYEIRLNQIAFDYIVENNLYNGQLQARAESVNFPINSTLIKAAWSEVSDDDADSSKFITREACLCDPVSIDALNNRNCRQSKVRLIGFHITKKTQDAPQWLWSTFEHTANLTNIDDISSILSDTSKPLFYAGFSQQLPQTPSSIDSKKLLAKFKQVDGKFNNANSGKHELTIKNQSYKDHTFYIFSKLNTKITDVELFANGFWFKESWTFTNIGSVIVDGDRFYIYQGNDWIGHADGEFRIRFSQESHIYNNQTPQGMPANVSRVLPIEDPIKQLNQKKQAEFRRLDSALSHYQLVSVQWPSQQQNSASTPTVFTANPEFSANTTMETFAQKTSSCIGCHAMARTLKPDEFISSDFTFTLNNAKPHPSNAICNKYVSSESMSCSEQIIQFNENNASRYEQTLWNSIKKGYQLANNTYEQLPDNVGNKLHCSSCHLQAGGDPKAAWWVGSKERYANKIGGINARINQCFRRSMNGTNLCNGDDCDSNKDINAIKNYMQWLSDTYNNTHTQTPVYGFPVLTTYPVGNIANGNKIYNQKCAFCHADKGQGRYESNQYFRPALWGDNSYNNSAGMNKVYKLAGFIRANMPYGSGSMLTNKEAKDVACFINKHNRPQSDFDANSSTDQRNACQ